MSLFYSHFRLPKSAANTYCTALTVPITKFDQQEKQPQSFRGRKYKDWKERSIFKNSSNKKREGGQTPPSPTFLNISISKIFMEPVPQEHLLPLPAKLLEPAHLHLCFVLLLNYLRQNNTLANLYS